MTHDVSFFLDIDEINGTLNGTVLCSDWRWTL